MKLFKGFLSLCALSVAGLAMGFDDASPHVPGQLILKLKPGAAFAPLAGFGQLERLDPAQEFAGGGTYLIKLDQEANKRPLRAIAAELKQRYDAVYVEPNFYHYLNNVPNDPLLSQLYGLHNTGQTGGSAGADIKALSAWKVTTGSRDILVGITDTGIDYNHPDLRANIWHNPGETGVDAQGNDKATNGIDDDGNGYVDDFRGWDFINNDNDPMDDHGHGSHCAGTIGGSGDNGEGVVGVNWDVSLVAMKVFSAGGSTTTDALTKAIYYNSTIGVQVSSNSWGGGPFSQAIYDGVKDNGTHGVLFVAAAGNSGRNTDVSPNYPSGYDLDNIVSVAATDHNDRLAGFSNYGLKTVDVAAPGVNILSVRPGSGYQKMSGTSMATPHVAGLAALVWSAFPNADFVAIKNRIIGNADQIGSVKGKVATGRVNALNALSEDTEAPSVPEDLEFVNGGITTIDILFTGSGDNGKVGSAAGYEIRSAPQPITSAAEWQAATPRTLNITGAKGGKVIAAVGGFNAGDSGYIAVQAIDKVGNRSGISDSVYFETNDPFGSVRERLSLDIADAIGAGTEADGRQLVLCVTAYQGAIKIGKDGRHLRGCHIPVNGSELVVADYYYIRADADLDWQDGSAKVPADALEIGSAKACRASFKSGIHSGTYDEAAGACQVSYGGSEYSLTTFEILVVI